MVNIIIGILIVLSSFFSFIAAIGIIKMPDTLTRMHASTKAGTLSTILIMCAVAMNFSSLAVYSRTLLIIIFLMLTAPLAAHMLGRSSIQKEL